MEPGGVTFTVQLKKSGTQLTQKDERKISLGASGDSTLDWQTFKSYLSRNLSKNDDFSVAYVDSSEDEVPIESECEFREALSYARRRSQSGLETILKVKQEPQLVLNSQTNGSDKTPSNLNIIGKKSNPNVRYVSKEKKRSKHSHQIKVGKSSNMSYSLDQSDLLRLVTIIGQLQKNDAVLADTPPPWFRRYMRKFKRKIVTKLTNVFLQEIERSKCCHMKRTKKCHSSDVNKSKMKSSNGSTSAVSEEIQRNKLFKKREKVNKQGKGLEKKFDNKPRKLENETKEMIQKYSEEKSHDCKLSNVKKPVEPNNAYVMDVILLNECKEMFISPSESFTKEWEVINTGSMKWSERTELRHVWSTSGLEPEKTVALCPLLQPGETGTILMKFIAPDRPGKYNSFWHFYNNEERFGHWLGCAVIVKHGTPKVQEVDNHARIDKVTIRNTSDDNDKLNNKVEARISSSEGKMNEGMHHSLPKYVVEYDSSETSEIESYKNNSENENFVVLPWFT